MAWGPAGKDLSHLERDLVAVYVGALTRRRPSVWLIQRHPAEPGRHQCTWLPLTPACQRTQPLNTGNVVFLLPFSEHTEKKTNAATFAEQNKRFESTTCNFSLTCVFLSFCTESVSPDHGGEDIQHLEAAAPGSTAQPQSQSSSSALFNI